MRLSVRFNDKWFVVPCGEGDNTVQWLIEETIRRSEGAAGSEKSPLTAQNFEAVLAQGGAMLDPNDAINEVLNDNEFVHLSGKYSVKLCVLGFCIQYLIDYLFESFISFDRSIDRRYTISESYTIQYNTILKLKYKTIRGLL